MADDTHEVFNQVPPLVGHDTAADAALLEGLEREGAGWAADEIHELGRLAGSAEAQAWGGWPSGYRRGCSPTTATATGSTRSSTSRPTTS